MNGSALSVLGILLLIFIAEPSLACSCAYKTIEERFDEADYAFTAEVIAAKIDLDPDIEYRTTGEKVLITIGSARNYKGDSSELKELYTYSSAGACGVAITVARAYTFLVNKNGQVHLCGSVVGKEEWREFRILLMRRGLN